MSSSGCGVTSLLILGHRTCPGAGLELAPGAATRRPPRFLDHKNIMTQIRTSRSWLEVKNLLLLADDNTQKRIRRSVSEVKAYETPLKRINCWQSELKLMIMKSSLMIIARNNVFTAFDKSKSRGLSQIRVLLWYLSGRSEIVPPEASVQ